jgi:DNA-directed RNA polymerase alpha subunit
MNERKNTMTIIDMTIGELIKLISKTPHLIAEIDRQALHAIFSEKIDSRPFCYRAAEYFKLRDIVYVGDLVQKEEQDLLRIPNFGRKSLTEISAFLGKKGLHFGMDVRGWNRQNIYCKQTRKSIITEENND